MLGKLPLQQLLLDSYLLLLLRRLCKVSPNCSLSCCVLRTRSHFLMVVRRKDVESLSVRRFGELAVDVETSLDVFWNCVRHVDSIRGGRNYAFRKRE
jgi:hypothetical protein